MMGTRGSERRAVALLGSLVLSVCILTGACRDKRMDASSQTSAAGRSKNQAGASRVVRASASTELASFDVGQWVRYTIRYRDGRRSTLAYKVVNREQNALWVEVVTGVANAGTVLQLLITPGDRTRLDDTNILAARISMPNAAVRELRGLMLDPSRSGYLKTLGPLFPAPFAGAPKENIETDAGKFEGCCRLEHPLAFGELSGPSTVWIHPSVPLTGLVRATPRSGEATIELEGFGAQGAQTSMKRRR